MPPSSPFASPDPPVAARAALLPDEHAHAIRVRYADSDQMGVSYYANYLVWFEVGRTEWLRTRGCTYRSLEATGVFLPVTEATCRYLAPTRYDDLLTVCTRMAALARASIRFDYRVLSEAGRVVATGHTVHPFLDAGGRPLRVPAALRATLTAAPR